MTPEVRAAGPRPLGEVEVLAARPPSDSVWPNSAPSGAIVLSGGRVRLSAYMLRGSTASQPPAICAWTAVMATTPTMSSAEQPRAKVVDGLGNALEHRAVGLGRRRTSWTSL